MDLDFRDSRMNDQEIDPLIGMDYYWNIVNDGIQTSGKGGSVAVNSKWLLSGPFYNNKETVSMHLAAMKLATWYLLALMKIKAKKLDSLVEREHILAHPFDKLGLGPSSALTSDNIIVCLYSCCVHVLVFMLHTCVFVHHKLGLGTRQGWRVFT